MDIIYGLLATIAGYLTGSISSARLVTRIFASDKPLPEKTELALEGSEKTLTIGTISATTVSQHIGSKYGFLTFVLDVLKVAIPTLVIKLLVPEQPYFLFVAAAGLIGHIWPVYHKFKGGRGVSAIYGGLFVLDWIGVFATSIVGMIVGLVVFRDVLVAYMAGVWLIIPWLWFRTHNIYYVLYAVVVNIIFAIAMIPEWKNWMRIKKEEKWDDPVEVFQLQGMGRGLIKMAKKLGILKKKAEQKIEPGEENTP
jgi:glycerol-3-phosphate acyltransferase PlsY